MRQELHVPDVICEEYDHLHSCITLSEVRWLLHHVPRFSPHWMYFVLRITTGMRPHEAVALTLYHLSPDCRTINYRVDKAATRLCKSQEYVQKRKHRRIVLDEWTVTQLREYLDRTCRLVNGVYVSPHPQQKLFPWSSMMTVGAYWYKLRLRMQRAGFESLRMVREYKRPGNVHRVFVVRPHILRHFAVSVMMVRLGNIASVRDWIKHEDVEITNGYIHSPESLGTTYDYLRTAPWPDILGYDADQRTLSGNAPSQTSLDAF